MDAAVINCTNPSIGQVEYLKYLQAMRAVQKPSFMLVEMELPAIDVTAVGKTVALFLNRHESLRTVFPLVGDEIRQVVLPATDERFQLQYVNATQVDDQGFSSIRQMHFDNAAAAFADIETGPLTRMLMFRRSDGYVFSLLIHHIICDEWSRGIAGQELITIYQSFLSDSQPELPPLTVTLKDYCEQQNKWLSQNKQELSAFWRRKLQDFDTLFDIADYHRAYARRTNLTLPDAAAGSGYEDAELAAILDKPDASAYTSILSGELFAEVKSMAAGNKSTISAFIYAGFFLLLHAYTGKRRLLVPALIADRYQPEYQQLIGCLLGAIYLAVSIDERHSVNDFIAELNADIIDVIMNGRLIFSHNYLGLDGNRLRNCCDMYINYFSKPTDLPADEYIIGEHENVDAIHYPIYAMAIEYNDALVIIWKYNKYLFDPAMIEDMVMYYREILQAMVSRADKTIREAFDSRRPVAHTL